MRIDGMNEIKRSGGRVFHQFVRELEVCRDTRGSEGLRDYDIMIKKFLHLVIKITPRPEAPVLDQ